MTAIVEAEELACVGSSDSFAGGKWQTEKRPRYSSCSSLARHQSSVPR